jgi:dUTP pyrophosphatase
MKVKIQNLNPGTALPKYQTKGSSGMDLIAAMKFPLTLKSMQRELIPTGIKISIPGGYEAQVRPRSGLAAKKGLTVLNTPGTIDSDYTGEISVILINLSESVVTVDPGERIAQLVFAQVEQAHLVEVDNIEATERGDSGFGSTGSK